MRIDFFVPVKIFDISEPSIPLVEIPTGLIDWTDNSEDSDFTVHLDGELRQLGFMGEHFKLELEGKALRGRISFHSSKTLSQKTYCKLRQHVEDQLSDGYGEDGIEARIEGERFRIEFKTGGLSDPIFTEAKPILRKSYKENADQTADIAQLFSKAAHEGDVDQIRDLLAKNFRSPGGISNALDEALIAACLHSETEIANLLLDAGANPDAKTTEGQSALFFVESLEIMDSLISNGANSQTLWNGETLQTYLNRQFMEWEDEPEEAAKFEALAKRVSEAH